MKKPISCIAFSIFLFISCKKKSQTDVQPVYTGQYTVAGNKIYNYNNPVQLMGANAFHVFGTGSSDMNSWNIDIAREFVGNVKEARLTGNVFVDANGAYLHSLQTVVDSNRLNKRITILCPFQWDGLAASDFTGKMPALTYWWADFKIKLQQWATHFKDQPDVWLELWNEPYRYDRADGYTDNIWMSNMNELTAIIRGTGNKNIILVPGAEQGQDESVLINKGVEFLNGKANIVFDIHAYEKWLLVPAASMGKRLQQLKQLNLPIIFAETAPMNAGVLMNPGAFLDSVYNRGISAMAWVWKYDGNDTDALLNAQALPNNNSNNNWGSLYKNFCLKPRKP
jgi:mannan endo-1,4-beta-mannosidase